MSRVYVGNLDSRVTERDLEDEFRVFGVIRSVWVARRPPGYAFIDFDDRRDAQDAIRELDGMCRRIIKMAYILLCDYSKLLMCYCFSPLFPVDMFKGFPQLYIFKSSSTSAL
ncbi:hypothetical protein KIW84_060916 [Lathyrus oleraceus]|uniref:RRM domain-containing protein n=1 Tax=Pisum sativum TaxID=3888 RepID=A0A9D5A1K9_PEA|nr:hypothetical protein KIW84_060916 [Pisum sativum]